MNIDSSYINAYNVDNINPTTVQRLSNSDILSNVENDNSNSQLFFSDNFLSQKSTLSQSIENINGGLAISAIAQNGISKQDEILENIKQQAIKLDNEEISLEEATDNISKYIEEFEGVVQEYKYNGQSLLETNGDSSDDISIIADDSIIELSKADTTSISDSLKSFMTDLSANPSVTQNILNIAQQGQNQLSSYAKDFSDSSDVFETMAKDQMKKEFELSNAPSSIKNIDYSSEVTDFNKTNLMSQMGYLMQTQANAAQAKNIALLS